MVAGCGNRTVKFLVFFFNFLIFVGGTVILGVSLWAALDPNFTKELPDKIQQAMKEVGEDGLDVKKYTVALYVLAGVGGFLMLVGFLGCCGAWCESRFLLGVFFVIVLILTVIQLAAIIAAFVLKNKFYDYLDKEFTKIWADDKAREAFKPVMETFKCCGVRTPDPSYCPGTYPDYKKGCLDTIWSDIKSKAVAAGAIAIVVIIIEVLAMIFACVLCSAYGRRDGYYA